MSQPVLLGLKLKRKLVLYALLLSLSIGVVAAGALTLANRVTVISIREQCVRLFANIVGSDDVGDGLRRLSAFVAGIEMFADASEWIVDGEGNVISSRISSGDPGAPIAGGNFPRPTDSVEVVHGHSGWFSLPEYSIARLASGDCFLIVRPRPHASLVALIASRLGGLLGALVLLSMGVLALSAWYFRRRSAAARGVLAKIRGGDLSARFESGAIDEAAPLMREFNAMADEIESLVLRLRRSEKGRRELLLGLGHDLRTPLTSLRASAETLLHRLETLDRPARSELMAVIAAEIEYLADLVDELFCIADLSDPKYVQRDDGVDLAEIVRGNAESNPVTARNLSGADHPLPVIGDRLLLSRLVRNAIDNAEKNCRERVEVELSRGDDGAVLRVRDDGPGLSPDGLLSFGVRPDRRSGSMARERSLGLGSVIMRHVVEACGGAMAIRNRTPIGAELEIRLPLSRISQGELPCSPAVS